ISSLTAYRPASSAPSPYTTLFQSVNFSGEPPLLLIVPPTMAPPKSRQLPRPGANASIGPAVLVSVSARLTVAPVACKVPSPATEYGREHVRTPAAAGIRVPSLDRN